MSFRKGVTLIEVVVSLALIGIIAVSMLTIFDTGLMNIYRAGSRTKSVTEANYNVQNSSVLVTADAKVELVLPDLVDTSITYEITGNVVEGLGSEPTLRQGVLEVEIIEFMPQLVEVK